MARLIQLGEAGHLPPEEVAERIDAVYSAGAEWELRTMADGAWLASNEPRAPAGRDVAGTPDAPVDDGDRARVVAELREHFVAGRLTLDDLSGRIRAAYDARTHGELDAIVRDLPLPPPETRWWQRWRRR